MDPEQVQKDDKMPELVDNGNNALRHSVVMPIALHGSSTESVEIYMLYTGINTL